jgi:hypothetical protein
MAVKSLHQFFYYHSNLHKRKKKRLFWDFGPLGVKHKTNQTSESKHVVNFKIHLLLNHNCFLLPDFLHI